MSFGSRFTKSTVISVVEFFTFLLRMNHFQIDNLWRQQHFKNDVDQRNA
jgi:hypothetical protein